MGMFSQSETPTEKHRDKVIDHLEYLIELAADAHSKYSEDIAIQTLKALKDMANFVYERQIEDERRDRQYQAAEDAMDEIRDDPGMW
ncbi:hypothetical protein Goe24_00550 [Bacillus phage vB_BsuM-Goe24]|uniref:Uncharacterized protein n=1 Tax=Bacillus phage vB_BsuM-Goe3 TaxID=1933063 RepID=A0A217ER18_BPGO3|nr:hypothetical protein HWB07_gp055 [Bacillus phage vB_BsuM-Goe3]APZ82521.1 hypothetical protein Goe3_c05500 [Bacillus phage vB_BsuM-Goe3]QDP43085.1 hypothetical protein Goe7_c00550 [Bacillus phage vB_BveM-Goe7]WCS69435.1 hypothetical protein Goe24_00550 [Bacillus phage vB_BsuM-Goe24]